MKKILSLILVTVMTLGMFAACAPAETPGSTAATDAPAADTSATEAATNAPASTDAPAGGEAVINLGAEPPEMNSILTTSTGSMDVLRHIMDGLVTYDANDAVIPAAAESWEYDESTLTYTFKIREGQMWSNGEPVTAHDFVFAWTTHLTPETAADYAGVWAPTVLGGREYFNSEAPSAETQAALDAGGYEGPLGFKAVDDMTLQVTTGFPCAYFLDALAFPSFMPVNQKAYEEIGADAYGTEVENIVTNGPFAMTEWTHENSIVLEKNPNHWDAANTKLDKITMMMITDAGTAFNSFLADEIDMIGLNAVQSAQLVTEGRDVKYFSDASVWYMQFNHTIPGLNNPKVRKALTLGADVQALIDNVIQNGAQVATGLTPPAIVGGAFAEEVAALNLYPRVTDGDYSEIKALFEEGLAEEGLTAADLNWTWIGGDTDFAKTEAAFYQEQWATNLGLNVEIESLSYQMRLDRMTQKDFDIVSAGWSMDYNDPMTYMDLFITDGGNNDTSYSNPAYDKLIADATIEPDVTARTGMLVETEKILATDYPVGITYWRSVAFITDPNLTGVARTAQQNMNLRWAAMA